MNAGFRGLYVISWAQTEIDGVSNAPALALHVGAGWQWRGDALRVDGPTSVLLLDEPIGEKALRKRAAQKISRQFGIKTVEDCIKEGRADRPDSDFTVTDGRQGYEVRIIESDDQNRFFLMFEDELPPRGRQLWIARIAWKPQRIRKKGKIRGWSVLRRVRISSPNGACSESNFCVRATRFRPRIAAYKSFYGWVRGGCHQLGSP